MTSGGEGTKSGKYSGYKGKVSNPSCSDKGGWRAESSGTNRQWNRPGSVSTAGCYHLAELGSQEECLDFHLQSLSDLVWGGPMPLVDDMNVQPGPRKTLGRGNSTGRQWERRAHE